MNGKMIPRMTLRLGSLGVMVLMLVCTNPLHAEVDPNKVIDLRADLLRIEGGKQEKVLDGAVWVQKAVVTEGTTIGISCDWSANLVGAGYWKTKVQQTWQVIIKRDGGTLGFGPASMPAGTELGSKSTSSSGIGLPTVDSPSPFKSSSSSTNFGTSYRGTFGTLKWTAKGGGTHKFECIVPKTGFEEPTLENNIATAYVEVVPKQKVGIPGGQAVAIPAGIPLAPPDITSEGRVVVAGKATAWRGMIIVDAKEAIRVAGGQCEFPLKYTVRNAGLSSTGQFGSLWQNSPPTGSFRRSWMPLAPGVASTQTDLVMLKPGLNVLRLTLDNAKQVAESNEGNNTFQVTVSVNGSCGGTQAVRGAPGPVSAPPPVTSPVSSLSLSGAVPPPPLRGR